MKRVIVFWLIIGILMGVNFMSFLNETSGKVRMKPLTIGDGVDKVHSPLQVSPNMATDMLNLSSKDFPTMTTRYGIRQLSYFSQDLVLEVNYGYIKPFVDSAGNIHIAFLSQASGGDLKLHRYIIKNDGTYYTEKISTNSLTTSTVNVFTAEEYRSINFVENNGCVYMPFVNSAGEYTLEEYRLYDERKNDTEITVQASSYASPFVMYLNRAFLATGNPIKEGNTSYVYQLTYSYPQNIFDFTTVGSGNIPMSKGGKITALIPMRDRLFIGMETAIYCLFGTAQDSFSAHLLSDTLGVKSNYAHCQKDGIIYFISNTNDVYEYNGNSLVNITREPIDTGSKSGVKGGFKENAIQFTSLSVANNTLRAIFGNAYVFDLNKRRWYIEGIDLPDNTGTAQFADGFEVIAFNSTTEHYDMLYGIADGANADKLEIVVTTSSDNDNDYTLVPNFTGAKYETISGTLAGTLTSGNAATMNYYINGRQSILLQTFMANKTASEVAAAYRSTLNGVNHFGKDGLYVAGGSGAVITITSTQYSDANLSYNISGTGLTTLDSTTTQEPVLPLYPITTSAVARSYFWQSPCYQLDTTGRQLLKSVHFSYYSPNGTEIGLYVSKTVDGDDFERVATLPTSALKQSQKFVLPINRYKLSDWVRIRIQGHGAIEIYNMTMEWRVLGKLR